MQTARHITTLVVVSLFFPPLGLLLLGLYILFKAAKHYGRDGGIVARKQADQWAAEEPWWTGDQEKDDAEIARRRARLSTVLLEVDDRLVDAVAEQIRREVWRQGGGVA